MRLVPSSLLGLLAVAACGPATKPPVPGPSPQHALPPATPADQECAYQEQTTAGNFDRYAFLTDDEDPRTGYKDGKGEVVIPPRFGFAYEFGPGGVAGALDLDADGGGRFVFIDPSGAVIAQSYAFDNGPDYFQEGLARIVVDGKVGYIDETGATVIPPRFDDAYAFCHGRAMVHDATSEWEIDRTGAAVGERHPYVHHDNPCG